MIGMALGLVALSAMAQPVYQSGTATGTTAATLIWNPNPLQQVRLVGTVATSDKAGSVLSFRTGTTATSISLSNPTGTTITVARTNGIDANALIVWVRADGSTNKLSTVSSLSYTNLTLAATIGNTTLPGEEVFVMSAAQTLPVGAATQSYQGEAIFVGNKGRPVSCVLDGTSACTINSQSARYE